MHGTSLAITWVAFVAGLSFLVLAGLRPRRPGTPAQDRLRRVGLVLEGGGILVSTGARLADASDGVLLASSMLGGAVIIVGAVLAFRPARRTG